MTHVTPKNKMKLSISNLRTHLFTIATMSAECAFRFSNFKKFKVLFIHASVPLFTSSDNQDIVRLTNGVHADKVTLCVL